MKRTTLLCEPLARLSHCARKLLALTALFAFTAVAEGAESVIYFSETTPMGDKSSLVAVSDASWTSSYGTVTYNGTEYSNAIKMETSTSITVTADADYSVTMYFTSLNGSPAVKINGTETSLSSTTAITVDNGNSSSFSPYSCSTTVSSGGTLTITKSSANTGLFLIVLSGTDESGDGGESEEEDAETGSDDEAEEEAAAGDGMGQAAFFEFLTLENSDGSVSDTTTGEATATGCSAVWEGISESDVVTIDGDNYYKFSKDASYVTLTPTEGTFESGDSVVIDFCTNASGGKAISMLVNGITVSGEATSSEAAAASYTLTDDSEAITVERGSKNGSAVRIHSISVYRTAVPSVTLSASASEVGVNETVTLTATMANVDGGTLTWTRANGDTISTAVAVSGTTMTYTDAIESKGVYSYWCSVTADDFTAMSDTVTVTGVSLFTPVLTSSVASGILDTDNDTTCLVPAQYSTVSVAVESRTTDATVYYFVSDKAFASGYTSGDGSGWTEVSENAISITGLASGTDKYLTVVAVLEGEPTETAFAYVHYKSYYPWITLDKTNAISSVAKGNSDALGVKVLYVYEKDGSSLNDTIDATSSATLEYTSRNTNYATVDSEGNVTGVKVGTATVCVRLTALAGYDVTGADTVNVSVNVTAEEMPVIKVSGGMSYTVNDGEYSFSEDGDVTVTFSWSGDENHTIFYTLDGSIPTWKSRKYSGSEGITLNTTTYVYAIAYETCNDETGRKYCNPSSIARASIRLPSTKEYPFEEGMSLDGGDQMEISGDDGETLLIATFGSDGDDEAWDSDGAADHGEINGSKLGFKDIYTVLGESDALSEPASFYKSGGRTTFKGNNYTTADSVNTFNIPISGTYAKFEPKEDGEVNVLVRQNGIYASDIGDYLNMNKRLMFVCDETGEPIDSLRATINPNTLMDSLLCTYNESTEGMNASNIEWYQQLVYCKYMTLQGYDMDIDNMTDSEKSAAKAFWEGNSTPSFKEDLPYNIAYKYGKGWLTMSQSYVRYSFPVEAGRTYFMMGQGTKLGPGGFSFHPRSSAQESEAETVEIDGKSTENVTLPSVLKEACNVSYTRELPADTWLSLVLPFSVSPSMVEDVFGEGAEILHFEGVSNDTLCLMKHFHQMIVAGTPVFIKPAQNVDGALFEGVTYGTYTYAADDIGAWYVSEAGDVPEADNTRTSGEWTLQCSYTPKTTEDNFYLLVNNDESGNGFFHYGQSTTLAGTRAWLESSSSSASIKAVSFSGITDIDGGETTGILNALAGDGTAGGYVPGGNGSGNIYTISGQVVRRAEDGVEGLAKGIYIVNGKKVVVK